MADTTEARLAIASARARHREVMGGLSTAELKLQAAGGVLGEHLPYAEDDPIWLDHASEALDEALTACISLRLAIQAAIARVSALKEASDA